MSKKSNKVHNVLFIKYAETGNMSCFLKFLTVFGGVVIHLMIRKFTLELILPFF